jgi:Zn-dependent protease
MDGMTFPLLLDWYAVFLLSLVVHEAAHSLVALWGGDLTAQLGGQVTLNPWPHIRREPVGTVVVPILSLLIMHWTLGWASAPYNPVWARRYPSRHAVMSAAGPAANLLLALAAFLLLKGLIAAEVLEALDWVRLDSLVKPAGRYEDRAWASFLATILSIGLSLNLLLFLFNLIPLPPMDGSAILSGLFPRSIGRFFESLKGDSIFSLLGLLFAWKVFPSIYEPVWKAVVRLL